MRIFNSAILEAFYPPYGIWEGSLLNWLQGDYFEYYKEDIEVINEKDGSVYDVMSISFRRNKYSNNIQYFVAESGRGTWYNLYGDFKLTVNI